MAWMVVVRKYFNRQAKNKNVPSVNLNNLIAYLGKVHGADLDALKFVIDKVPFEVNLSKGQLAGVFENYFRPVQAKKKEKEGVLRVSFIQVLNCMLQYQTKISSSKHKDNSSEEHEEGI